MGTPAAKNRLCQRARPVFVEHCIFMEKSPYKKQIATAPMCRGSFVSGGSLPIAGLPIAIRKDHIVQITRDELVQHRTYHAPFLLLILHLYYTRFPLALQVESYTYFTILFSYFLIKCTVPLALFHKTHYNIVH